MSFDKFNNLIKFSFLKHLIREDYELFNKYHNIFLKDDVIKEVFNYEFDPDPEENDFIQGELWLLIEAEFLTRFYTTKKIDWPKCPLGISRSPSDPPEGIEGHYFTNPNEERFLNRCELMRFVKHEENIIILYKKVFDEAFNDGVINKEQRAYLMNKVGTLFDEYLNKKEKEEKIDFLD